MSMKTIRLCTESFLKICRYKAFLFSTFKFINVTWNFNINNYCILLLIMIFYCQGGEDMYHHSSLLHSRPREEQLYRVRDTHQSCRR